MKAFNKRGKPKHFTKGRYKRKGLYEIRYSKPTSAIFNFDDPDLFLTSWSEIFKCGRYDTYPLVESWCCDESI